LSLWSLSLRSFDLIRFPCTQCVSNMPAHTIFVHDLRSQQGSYKMHFCCASNSTDDRA
jgi:hypothetical protein